MKSWATADDGRRRSEVSCRNRRRLPCVGTEAVRPLVQKGPWPSPAISPSRLEAQIWAQAWARSTHSSSTSRLLSRVPYCTTAARTWDMHRPKQAQLELASILPGAQCTAERSAGTLDRRMPEEPEDAAVHCPPTCNRANTSSTHAADPTSTSTDAAIKNPTYADSLSPKCLSSTSQGAPSASAWLSPCPRTPLIVKEEIQHNNALNEGRMRWENPVWRWNTARLPRFRAQTLRSATFTGAEGRKTSNKAPVSDNNRVGICTVLSEETLTLKRGRKRSRKRGLQNKSRVVRVRQKPNMRPLDEVASRPQIRNHKRGRQNAVEHCRRPGTISSGLL